jgi:hypothetical protein
MAGLDFGRLIRPVPRLADHRREARTSPGVRGREYVDLCSSTAPKPEDWSRLLGKIGDAMKMDFDFFKEIAGIKATTLVVAADERPHEPQHVSSTTMGDARLVLLAATAVVTASSLCRHA